MTDAFVRACAAVALILIAGCASVHTHVTLLDPGTAYAPTREIRILLDFPAQPHTRIALIEAQGTVGGNEAELLESARTKAQSLGADALVRLEAKTVYQPPVRVYDPFYDPWIGYPYSARHRYALRPYSYSLSPYAYGPFPFSRSEYRWVGGGNVQMLKAVAIKYAGPEGGDPAP